MGLRVSFLSVMEVPSQEAGGMEGATDSGAKGISFCASPGVLKG